ncbi:MAG: 30S ribosomal protein S14 [Bdellovibrionales bacterium]
MARTGDVQKNKRRAKMAKSAEAKRKALKAIIMNKKTPMEERFDAVLKLAKLPRNSAKNRQRNRCELTGRSRATYRHFRLARVILRNLAGFGQIPGLTKSSW